MILGVDGGNFSVKTSFANHTGDNAIVIPTATATYHDYNTGATNNSQDLIDALIVDITMNIDKKENEQKKFGKHLIGNKAREVEGENSDIRTIGKIKIGDETLLKTMLTSIAYAVCVDQNKFDGLVTDDIYMVTGLPYAEYKNYKDEYKNQFVGTHKIVFNEGAEVIINIKNVDVSFEGADALNFALYDRDGNFKYSDSELLDRSIVGINIGEGTTEQIVRTFCEEKGKLETKYIPKLCIGHPIGIANAKQSLIGHVQSHKNAKIDRYTIEKVVRRTIRRGDIDLNETEVIDGKAVKKTHNILDEYDLRLKTTAKTIATEVTNTLVEANEHNKVLEIILFGGAPKVLGKFGSYVVDSLKSTLKTNVIIAHNTSTADSDAYFEKALLLHEKVI